MVLPIRGERRRTIWVVDDIAIEAEVARAAISESYDTVVFHDPSVMIERLAQGPGPDAIVLDWQMPIITGLEVCRFLRNDSVYKGIPVVLLTVHQRHQDIVEGLAAGADDYVTKPYDGAELNARLNALIRARADRERAEAAEAALLRLVQNLPDALLSIDADDVIRYVNAEAERVLGATAIELVGQRVGALMPDLQLDRLRGADGSDQISHPDLSFGERVLSPSVRQVIIGDASTLTLSLRDVTSMRASEERRLDFYSVIAHDLRSPLTAILMRTELILRGSRGEVGTVIREDLSRVKTRVLELVALINDFLDVARHENTKLNVYVDDVPLGALVLDKLDEYRLLADAKGVALTTEVDTPGPVVRGDSVRLGQAVTNLVANAVKFTPTGGRVHVRVDTAGGNPNVYVEDTGPGIKAEHAARLFQRYSRAPTVGSEAPGTGLGLMIVRQIVEAHGGTVDLKSTPGQGSTFAFHLPVG
ncbi:MAG: hypothetical protein NVS3B20_20340 [Polyangiales bacterium]